MRSETKVCKEIRKVAKKLDALNREHRLIIWARFYACLELEEKEEDASKSG